MSAHAIGHVHEPVQTLANTSISFSRPPAREKGMHASLPTPTTKILRIYHKSEGFFLILTSKAAPHNPARADSEKIHVLMKAVFRRNTLCIARKSDKIKARIIRKMPKTDCAVLP